LAAVLAAGEQKRLEPMIRRVVHERGMVFNVGRSADFHDYPWLFMDGAPVKGARVLEPKISLIRDPVVTCDYTSLYPSVIIARNLCPSNLVLEHAFEEMPPDVIPEAAQPLVRTFPVEEKRKTKTVDGKDVEYGPELVYHYRVLQSGPDDGWEGVIPTVVRQLLARRKRTKAEMKAHAPGSAEYALLDARQQAFKVLCNSMYGALGAVEKGKHYCRPLAAVTTSEGRSAIRTIEKAAEAHPAAEIVAGDTDSCMMAFRGCTLEQAEAYGREVAATVTRQYHDEGAVSMNLAFEKIMYPVVFIAAKCYSYWCYESASAVPKHVSMGTLSRKRGNPAILQRLYRNIELALLLDPAKYDLTDIGRLVCRLFRDSLRQMPIAANENPRDFAKSVYLRAEKDYLDKKITPPVAAARRMMRELKCPWPGGKRVQYVQALRLGEDIIRVLREKKSEHSYLLEHFEAKRDELQINYAEAIDARTEDFEKILAHAVSRPVARIESAFKMLKGTHYTRIGSVCSHSEDAPPAPLTKMVHEMSEVELRAAIEEPDSCVGDDSGACAFLWDYNPSRSGPDSQTTLTAFLTDYTPDPSNLVRAHEKVAAAGKRKAFNPKGKKDEVELRKVQKKIAFVPMTLDEPGKMAVKP
jgi:DNA polymerase elongation subunit (family B)